GSSETKADGAGFQPNIVEEDSGRTLSWDYGSDRRVTGVEISSINRGTLDKCWAGWVAILSNPNAVWGNFGDRAYGVKRSVDGTKTHRGADTAMQQTSQPDRETPHSGSPYDGGDCRMVARSMENEEGERECHASADEGGPALLMPEMTNDAGELVSFLGREAGNVDVGREENEVGGCGDESDGSSAAGTLRFDGGLEVARLRRKALSGLVGYGELWGCDMVGDGIRSGYFQCKKCSKRVKSAKEPGGLEDQALVEMAEIKEDGARGSQRT
ncbi:hypothetical protein S245_022014, partial [Arachis hypogaea]